MGHKYTYNLNIFNIINSMSAYLLGAFMTDGCVKKNLLDVSLTSNDVDWLQAIREIICPSMQIFMEGKAGRLIFHSKEMCNILVSYGCTPHKSIDLKFPNYIPSEYMPDFIRGCWDGDGCISFFQNKHILKNGDITYHPRAVATLCSSSEHFSKGMHDELSKQFKCCFVKVNIDKANLNRKAQYLHPHYKINVNNHNAKDLVEWLYYPEHILSMPRKSSKAKLVLEHYKTVASKRRNRSSIIQSNTY